MDSIFTIKLRAGFILAPAVAYRLVSLGKVTLYFTRILTLENQSEKEKPLTIITTIQDPHEYSLAKANKCDKLMSADYLIC